MKHFSILFFALLFTANTGLSQGSTWNYKIDATVFTENSGNYCSFIDNQFLVVGFQKVISMDVYGSITGVIGGTSAGYPLLVSNFAQKKYDPTSNKNYFVLGYKPILSSAFDFQLSTFVPGTNEAAALNFQDEIGSSQKRCPNIIVKNDSTYWVLGNKFISQVTVESPQKLTKNWEKPLFSGVQQQGVVASVIHNSLLWCVTEKGSLASLDAAGDKIFEKSFPNYYFYSLIPFGNGILASFSENGKGGVVEIDTNGNIVNTIPTNGILFSLKQTLDGGFAGTGVDSTGMGTLVKYKEPGTIVWTSTFQRGHGLQLLTLPEGGYFVLLLQSNPKGVFAIKTDENGVAPSPSPQPLRQSRNLTNGGFFLGQSPSPVLFSNAYDDQSFLLLTADTQTTVLSSAGLWLSGRSDSGLHVSASTHNTIIHDFRSGIMKNDGWDFRRVWAVNRAEIQALRLDFEQDGKLDQIPPFDLVSWPAKGNPHFIQNLNFTRPTTHPDDLPAPFVDFNGDGIYNVYDGDLPLLRGDRMIWWILCDDAPHKESEGVPLGVDIAICLYGYVCPQQSAVQYSLFAEYTIINRSNFTYTDAYWSMPVEPKLGCPLDDFIGTMPNAQTSFIYNSIDGNNGANCQGLPTFGENVAGEAIVFLNKTLDANIYMNRTGPASRVFPQAPLEFYNYAQGLWKDGTVLTAQGNGYNLDSTLTPVKYVYDGNPSDPNDWTMCETPNVFPDETMISSHGPFQLAPGDTLPIHLAFTFIQDQPHPCPNVDTWIKPTVTLLRDWYMDGTLNQRPQLPAVESISSGTTLTLDLGEPPFGASYLWSTGATTPNLTVSQAGTYTVTMTTAPGCQRTESVLVLEKPLIPQNLWTLQPNPASDQVSIVFENTDVSAIITLYSSIGTLIQTVKTDQAMATMRVAGLPKGVYIVVANSTNAFLGSKKLVIR